MQLNIGDLVNQPIPTRDAHRYRWLTLMGEKGWFYAVPRASQKLGSRSVDPATLDPSLRVLVSELHARGVATLPSCEGHFDPANILTANNQLLTQASLIRAGTWMEDVESGARVPVWVPGWRPVLLTPAWAGEMAEGYLGLAASAAWAGDAMGRLREVDGVRAAVWRAERPWLRLRVRTRSPSDQRRAWRAVEVALLSTVI
jgi:hypothetical protein